jgi:phosphatidylinositol alpha-1,6-mannosyltransferase
MLKTLLVTLDFPPNRGGVANYYWHLCKHLAKESIVVLAPENSYEAPPADFPIILRRWFVPFLFPSWLPLFWHIYSVARREKIQFLWAGQVLPVGAAVWIIAFLLRIPYILSIHGMEMGSIGKSFRKKFLLRRVLCNASQVIVNSEYTKDLVKAQGIDSQRIHIVLPCPSCKKVNSQKIHSDEKERLKAQYGFSGKKLILTVGRLVERKGQDRVIEAFPSILSKVRDAHYLIVGDGEYRPNLEHRIREMGLKDSISLFPNVLDDALLAIFYSMSDVFIMCSRDIHGDVEGFGIVYLEANSFGLPVIGGRSGGVASAIISGVTGLLVDPEDREEIAMAVIRLFSDDHLVRSLGEAGQKRVETEFRWERSAKVLENILSQTV